jgi:hypothetical protein
MQSRPVLGTHLLVIILILSLEGSLRNTIQITLARLSNSSATLLLVLLDDTDLLKSLEDFAVDGAGGIDVVGGAGSTVLGGAGKISLALFLHKNGVYDNNVPVNLP